MSTRFLPSPLALLHTLAAPALCGPAVSVPAVAHTFTVLYTFDSVNYANGSQPIGSLAMDANGVLYGVTSQGGAYVGCVDGAGVGCGTVYSLTPPASPGGAWTEAVLWSFGASPSDGANPTGLVMGRNGVLYGTTTYGGQADCGAVFSLTPPSTPGGEWTEAIIWSFPANGLVFPTGLVAGSNGGLYGANLNGGPYRGGDIYSLDPPSAPGGAWRHKELWYSIESDPKAGGDPMDGVVIGPDNVLYATAYFGGSGHSGIVFSLTPPSAPGAAWTETILYEFPEGTGWHPMTLSLGANGVLYGTTNLRAPTQKQGGTIFSLTPPSSQGEPWTGATVWQFPTIKEGATSDQPNGPLFIQPQTGALFGATGDYQSPGVLFELVPPSPGGSNWSRQTLPPKQKLIAPVVGLGSAGALYGTDAGTNTIWSLTL